LAWAEAFDYRNVTKAQSWLVARWRGDWTESTSLQLSIQDAQLERLTADLGTKGRESVQLHLPIAVNVNRPSFSVTVFSFRIFIGSFVAFVANKVGA
jgi:hypothetical protein